MAQQEPDPFDIQDPNDVEAGVSANLQNQVIGSKDWMSRGLAVANQGFNTAANGLSQATGNPDIGDPRVVQARHISDAMKNVVAGVNATSPEDEDPLDKNIRVSEAISKQMMNISPAIALQALQKTAQLQQAKTQQDLLQTQVATAKQNQVEKARQDQVNAATGQVVFAKKGPEENGLPTGLISMGTLDPSDPDYAQKALKIINDAKANGDDVMPMKVTDFINSKDSTAAIRAQALVQKAQLDGQNRLQDILAKGQAGQMDSRSMSIAARVSNAVSLAVPTLQNITELPIGSSTGVFGIGAAPGHSLMQSSVDTLRNSMSSDDVRRYNVMVTGLSQNLANIETAGMLPRGTFINSLDRISFRAGDDPKGIDALTKLAEARQIIERGSRTMLNNPQFPQSLKDQMSQDLAQLQTTIPFTMHDVTELAKQQNGSKATIQDMIRARGLAEASDNPKVPSGPVATEQDIAADMTKHGKTRQEILDAYKAKGITVGVPQ
jgi:hypothetical protein